MHLDKSCLSPDAAVADDDDDGDIFSWLPNGDSALIMMIDMKRTMMITMMMMMIMDWRNAH